MAPGMTVTTAEKIMAAATRAVRTGRNFDTGPHLPGAAPFRAPHRHAEVRPGIGQRDISETPWWYCGSHGVIPRTAQSAMARSGYGRERYGWPRVAQGACGRRGRPSPAGVWH